MTIIISLFKRYVKCLLYKILYIKNPGIKYSNFCNDFFVIDNKKYHAQSICFTHVGGIGDILFSLYFCNDYAKYLGFDKFDLYIVSGRNGLPLHVAEFPKTLLESQEFINSVTVGEFPPTDSIMLNEFRKLKINFSSSDIRSWYYGLTQHHLPKEFWKPILFAKPNCKYHHKILITLTGRYRNVHLDCNYLKIFKDDLVFIGFLSEYNAFCDDFFSIPFCQCDNMLEMAEYMVGAKGFIGNQSGVYSLAECLKIPRILLAPDYVDYYGVIIPGPHNNLPIGGWNEDVSNNEKMIEAVKCLKNRISQ